MITNSALIEKLGVYLINFLILILGRKTEVKVAQSLYVLETNAGADRFNGRDTVTDGDFIIQQSTSN